jgi:thioesterase domain-containing protein
MLLSLIPVASLENHRRALVDAYPDIWRVDEEPVNAVEVAQWTLNRCNPERLADLDIKDASALLHWVRVAYDLTRTGRTFEPRGTTNAALTTIFSATTRTVFGETFDSWRAMTKGGYEMVDVDGDHYTIISDDNVGQFANKMRAALHRADTEGRATHTTVKKSVSPVIPFTISGRFSVAIKA